MSPDDWDGSFGKGEQYVAVIEADLRDGFIHCSSDEQVDGTLAKWYTDVDRVVVVTIDADKLTSELKWEPNFEGILFPHIYGPIVPEAVAGKVTMERSEAGEFQASGAVGN
jgi:uncharacterized protein (DUF952 family)